MRGPYVILFLFSHICWGQVGINTTNPQQAFHIAGTTATLRIESLNDINNSFNGGDVNGDGDLTNDVFPLYEDESGDFTLEFKPLYNSGELDALDDTTLPTNSVYLSPFDVDGYEQTDIVVYTIEINRPALLEIKYNLSFDVYLDTTKAGITDNLARKIVTQILVSGDSRIYGSTAKCYSSGSLNSVAGTMYNSNTVYISLPASGTYDITIRGEVWSDTIAPGGFGTTSKSTYVEFATGHDLVFFRLH